jgi:trehalose 6-phosphate phosphatase
MKILNPKTDLDLFFSRLRKAHQKALLLDYDGTLAPFHRDPMKAVPYPGVSELLNKLLRAPDIRVVIISGRWIKDLLPLLQLDKNPEIWGSHGLERQMPDGSYELAPMDEEALDGLVTADEWVQEMGLAGRCEEKPGSLALHWRGLDEREVNEIRSWVAPKWSLIADGWRLNLKTFDGGIELRVPGRDKGDAVETIFKEMGEDAVVTYLGDDLTDEDAFRAIKGKGLGILVRKELRQTAADIWIKPPDELLKFLSAWLPETKK